MRDIKLKYSISVNMNTHNKAMGLLRDFIKHVESFDSNPDVLTKEFIEYSRDKYHDLTYAMDTASGWWTSKIIKLRENYAELIAEQEEFLQNITDQEEYYKESIYTYKKLLKIHQKLEILKEETLKHSEDVDNLWKEYNASIERSKLTPEQLLSLIPYLPQFTQV